MSSVAHAEQYCSLVPRQQAEEAANEEQQQHHHAQSKVCQPTHVVDDAASGLPLRGKRDQHAAADLRQLELDQQYADDDVEDIDLLALRA